MRRGIITCGEHIRTVTQGKQFCRLFVTLEADSAVLLGQIAQLVVEGGETADASVGNEGGLGWVVNLVRGVSRGVWAALAR
jgi:hypothetical protein